MIRPLVCLLILMTIGCEQHEEVSQACYICSELPPHAQICTLEVGRIEERQETYICNLYFGASHLCESAQHCCGKFGLVSDEMGGCVSPKSIDFRE